MAFDAGQLIATIRLDGEAQVGAGLDNVGRKMGSTSTAADKIGTAAKSAMTAASAATGIAAAAVTALGVSLFKTGVSYNTLQQTSRAALKTLLGGAEAANEQMDKLDAFAKNSPFSKGVFIQAQQQLLGFGMEAQKVIPTLDAIQQSVAAVGGSNEDIAGITATLAKVVSSGKITAETFNEFGIRGVDAATLIGSEMGKTGAEIRESVTAGTLGAGEAVDALTTAMSKKFGGAADNVKETFAGTVDRIKAASRDIGAAMAEPFVSKNGGGLWVDWGNQVADVMRAVEKHVPSVVGILMDRAMPAFAGLTTALDSAKVSINSWNSDKLNTQLNALGDNAPGIAAVGAAFLSMGTHGKLLSSLGLSINPLLAGIVGLVAASPELRQSLMELLRAGEPLVPVIGQLASTLSGMLNIALPVTADLVSSLAKAAVPLVQIIADIPAPVLLGVAAFIGLNKVLSGPLTSAFSTVGKAVTGLGEHMAASRAVADAMGGGVSTMGIAARGAGTYVAGLGASMKAAFMTNPIGLAITGITLVAAGLAAAFGAAGEAAQKNADQVRTLRDSLDEATGGFTDLTEAAVATNITEALGDKLDKTGYSAEYVAKAVRMGGDELKLLKSALEETGKESTKFYDENGMQHEMFTQSALAAQKLTGEIGTQEQALIDAQAAEKLMNDQLAEAVSRMSDAERANLRMNDALEIARDTANDMTTRVKALKDALSELNGGTKSAEDAAIELTKANLGLKEGFEQVDDAGTSFWLAAVDGAGKLDLSTRSGIQFKESLDSTNTSMLEAITAEYDRARATGTASDAQQAAQKVGDDYIATLRGTLEAAGLTKEQVDQLIDTYFDIPAVASTAITDNGTISATDLQLVALADRIGKTPDKTVTISEPMSPEIIGRLQALGYTVDELPDGNIQVTETGSASARTAIESVAAGPYYATINVAQRLHELGGNTPMAPGSARGNAFTPSGAVPFAGGGMVSGMYQGVMGGIFKPGVDGRLHQFAEKHLGVEWETYISGKNSERQRNIQLAYATMAKLGEPVVSLREMQAARGYDRGGSTSTTASASPGVTVAPRNITIQLYTQPGQDIHQIKDLLMAEIEEEMRRQ